MADHAPSAGLEYYYELHRADLLRFLAARVGDRGEAEEVVQELWVKIRTVPAGPIENGRAYLYRMAQNLVLDRLRERRRRVLRDRAWQEQEASLALNGGEVPDGSASAHEHMEAREEASRLASAIGTLPEGARRVFCLHKIEGLSHGEVAAQLGISKSGVEKHMALAMKYLRRALLD